MVPDHKEHFIQSENNAYRSIPLFKKISFPHQMSSKTEDKRLMKVEFSCFRCPSFKILFFSLFFAIFAILYHLNFLHANFSFV